MMLLTHKRRELLNLDLFVHHKPAAALLPRRLSNDGDRVSGPIPEPIQRARTRRGGAKLSEATRALEATVAQGPRVRGLRAHDDDRRDGRRSVRSRWAPGLSQWLLLAWIRGMS